MNPCIARQFSQHTHSSKISDSTLSFQVWVSFYPILPIMAAALSLCSIHISSHKAWWSRSVFSKPSKVTSPALKHSLIISNEFIKSHFPEIIKYLIAHWQIHFSFQDTQNYAYFQWWRAFFFYPFLSLPPYHMSFQDFSVLQKIQAHLQVGTAQMPLIDLLVNQPACIIVTSQQNHCIQIFVFFHPLKSQIIFSWFLLDSKLRPYCRKGSVHKWNNICSQYRYVCHSMACTIKRWWVGNNPKFPLQWPGAHCLHPNNIVNTGPKSIGA